MDYLKKIIIAFEIHSVEEIRECFENGISPNQVINGKHLILATAKKKRLTRTSYNRMFLQWCGDM